MNICTISIHPSDITIQYHVLPGTNVSIPVMSLAGGQNLRSNKKDGTVEDPVAKAIKNGRAPTLKDVKMSVKVNHCVPCYFTILRACSLRLC